MALAPSITSAPMAYTAMANRARPPSALTTATIPTGMLANDAHRWSTPR